MDKQLDYFQQVAQAVEEEYAFTLATAKENLSKSPNELRKMGLSIFPCSIKSYNNEGNKALLQLETSFVINTAYIKRGSCVSIKTQSGDFDGRVYELNAQNISIGLNDATELDVYDKSVRVDFRPDDRTLTCMRLGMRFFQEKEELQLMAQDLGREASTASFSHPQLNASQQVAVASILSSALTTRIQGPPGTGKTYTLALAVLELIQNNKKVLICAPSNTAVDNLCFKIIELNPQAKLGLLRVGNEEKIQDALSPFTVDEKIAHAKNSDYLRALNKQLAKAQQVADRFIRNYSKEAAQEKKEAQTEVKQLRREINAHHHETTSELIAQSSVIAGTPVALFNALSKDFKADVLIIDEAGQALTPLVWLAASFARQLVLCGDPQQLPPLVLSAKARKLGLSKSLLEFYQSASPAILLTQQYRIPSAVFDHCNSYFYENKLADATFQKPGELYFVDTAGFGEGEQVNEETGSIENPSEVQVLEKLLQTHNLSPQNTVILSPYSAQIALIAKQLGATWRVSTIDSMQGQEAEHIVISLTRSNPDGVIGFLDDYRRMNVAITRTQVNCYILGDSSTLGNDDFYSKLIQHIEQQLHYKSAWEYEY
jgi:superfamily I DNA and/or RNA helicase